MAISVASRIPNSVRSSVTVSPTLSARAWTSVTGVEKLCCVMRLLESDSARSDYGFGAPCRVALDIHGHRIHRDMGGGYLHMHAKRRRASAEALRPDSQLIDRFAQLRLDPGAFLVAAGGAERPRRGDFGKMHAQVGCSADADADDCRGADAATAFDHLVDDKALDRADAVGRHQHLKK